MVKTPEKNSSGKRGRLKKVFLILFLVVAVVVTLLLILAPWIAKNYINKNGKELVGRSIQIEKVKFNYFTSSLQVIGFHLLEQNDTDVFIEIDTFLLNVKPLKILDDEIYVQQFQIVNSHAQIIQNDSIYNFSDLIEFFSTDNTISPEHLDTSNVKAYKLNLNLIEIRNGSLSFVDEKMEHSVALEEVSFLIPHIFLGAEEKSNADVSFKLGRGGSFSSSLDYNSKNGDFSGYANLSKLELEAFLPYMKEYIRFSDIDGTFSSELNFEGVQSDMEQISLQGSARIDNMKIKDEQDKEVLGFVSASAVLKEFKPLKYHAEVDLVQIDQPYVYFALIDSMSNFDKMLVQPSVETAAKPKPEPEDKEENIPKQVVLNRFVINNGLIDFSDQRFRENFDYELSEVTVDMDTITLQDEWININANMKLNKRGSLEANLGINPMDPMKRIDLEYVLTDFQLPDVNIYSKHYIGLPILFGEMYYKSKTSIVDRKLESNNELVITNVEMGRKTGGLYELPIKLAMFILKDINGDVVLDIPVSGDLSDPKVKISSIVWNTFKGFMFKIVASPFKALGSILGADPEELEEIALNYGDTLLMPKQTRSLDLLMELEQLKPGIQIDMHYLNDKKLERIDAATVLMQQSFFEKYNKKANLNRKDYLEFLQETSGQDSLVLQDYELLLAPDELVDSMIQQREIERLNLVRDYFATKSDSTAIRVFDFDSNELLNIGSRPRFAIKYGLAEDEEQTDSVQ